jgi:hypothetical protein
LKLKASALEVLLKTLRTECQVLSKLPNESCKTLNNGSPNIENLGDRGVQS